MTVYEGSEKIWHGKQLITPVLCLIWMWRGGHHVCWSLQEPSGKPMGNQKFHTSSDPEGIEEDRWKEWVASLTAFFHSMGRRFPGAWCGPIFKFTTISLSVHVRIRKKLITSGTNFQQSKNQNMRLKGSNPNRSAGCGYKPMQRWSKI